MLLANTGFQHPAIFLALSAGGLLYDNKEEEARGLKGLSALSPSTEEQDKTFQKMLLRPVMVNLLNEAIGNKDDAQVLRILEILKAAVLSAWII